jgi:hypothetical protein
MIQLWMWCELSDPRCAPRARRLDFRLQAALLTSDSASEGAVRELSQHVAHVSALVLNDIHDAVRVHTAANSNPLELGSTCAAAAAAVLAHADELAAFQYEPLSDEGLDHGTISSASPGVHLRHIQHGKILFLQMVQDLLYRRSMEIAEVFPQEGQVTRVRAFLGTHVDPKILYFFGSRPRVLQTYFRGLPCNSHLAFLWEYCGMPLSPVAHVKVNQLSVHFDVNKAIVYLFSYTITEHV